MNENAVEVHNVTYSYGSREVLKNLSLAVPREGFFIVIGPNGSGKTTLMKIMAAIEKPTRGRLELLGRPLDHYSRRTLAQTVAYVPQSVSVDFPFTVMEVVLMGRSPHLGILALEQARDHDIARQALEFTSVEHLADRKLDQLSGGERQRVFIARAICQQPRVILLDEPTAALDLAHQIRVMDLMARLKAEKAMTVIMVSHDVNLAAMYADRLLLLKEGEIVSLGTPGQVLTSTSLEETYGCRLLVDQNPLGDFPRITLMPEKSRNCLKPPTR